MAESDDRGTDVKGYVVNLFSSWRSDVIELKKRLISNLSKDQCLDVDNINYVAGVDISFRDIKSREDKVHACVTLVVIEMSTREIVYQHSSIVHMEVPYISGYLGFREAQFYKDEWDIMRQRSNFCPEVLLVDGNGVWHHEGFGSACHVGVKIDIPTIGVAKQLLYVDGLEKNEEFRSQCAQLENPGDSFELFGRSGRVLGRVLKSTDKSTKPIYVSVGHKINLENAASIVARLCKFRIPEPIRQADRISKRIINPHEARKESVYTDHFKTCRIDWKQETTKLKEMEVYAVEVKKEQTEMLDK